MIEIFFTCWIIFLSDGSAHCYCENEVPPVPVTQERVVVRVEAVREPE